MDQALDGMEWKIYCVGVLCVVANSGFRNVVFTKTNLANGELQQRLPGGYLHIASPHLLALQLRPVIPPIAYK